MQNKKSKTRMIVTMGVLIAIQIVLSRFCSIQMWNLKFGFGFVPIAVAAALFGPVPAAVVAAVSDVLGALLFPVGAFFPGFTLTAILTGIVYGLLLRKNRRFWKILLAVLINQFVLGLLLNTLWISILYTSPFIPLLVTRVVQSIVMTVVECVVIWAVCRFCTMYEKRLKA